MHVVYPTAPALRWSLALVLLAALGMGAQAQNLQALSSAPAEIVTPDVQFRAADGTLQPGVRCATPTPSERELEALAAERDAFLARFGQPQPEAITTIPVAFHVLRSGTAVSQGNVTDQQIADQIAVLNAAFANTNFRFTLATTTRTTNSSWFNGCYPSTGSTAAAMKAALAVSPATTFNIYSCNPSSGILGQAVFPWSYPENSTLHGIIALHSSLPGGSAFPYHLGDTITHEAGHYFGLYHTFQGGCAGGDTSPGCTTGGDLVCDTAAEASPAYGCPNGRNTCGTGGPDPITNFMDYTDDACMNNFTAGQSARADQMVAQYKPSLLGGSQALPQVAILRLSSSVVPATGGPMQFRLTFTNDGGAAFNGDYWVNGTLPNGSVRLVSGPTPVTVNPGQTITVDITANVPRVAPAGSYLVTGYIGDYPSDIDDADSFSFTKLAARMGGDEPLATSEAAPWTVVNEATGQTTTAPWTASATATQPVTAALLGAYPNPFNQSATIAYSVDERTEVSLEVYNALGQRVAVLAQGAVEAGRHEAVLDAASLPSGVYLYRLTAGGQVQTGRLMLAR